MWAIYKREIASFFQSVIGWLFLAATLALFGLYFYVYNLAYGSPTLANTLSATTIIMLITVPILTMRVLAEEQKSKTDQLILTAPISVGKVVLGKYLAVGTIFTIAVLVMGMTPLVLKFFGTVPLGECYAAVLGYWLFGMTCIAIGVFISSITESQVIAAVVTFGVLFIGYMMKSITQVISSTENIVTKILNSFDLTSSMDRFFSGSIDVKGVIYYLSLIGFFLFLTTQSIQKRRWSMSSRKLKLGAFSTGMIVITLAAVVAVNMAASQLPDQMASIDVTKEKLYSITKDTKKLLNTVNEDITIYVLANKKNQDATLEKTLKRYESASKHIKIEYKDPSVSPNFYQEYTDTALNANSLIVVGTNRSKVIDYSSIYKSEMDSKTYQQKVTGYDGEGQITSAISYVTSNSTSVMYAITGHDEYSLTGTFADALAKQNAELTTLNLLEQDAIPKDAQCLFLLAPAKDYSQDDVSKVLSYLENGGKAVIATNYTTENLTNFNQILEAYKITTTNGIVVENDKNHYYQNQYYLLPEIASDTVTSHIMDGYIFAPFAQGLSYPVQDNQENPEEEAVNGITYTPLLTTSEQSFAKSDVTNAKDFTKGENDVEGPFTIGLHVSKSLEENKNTELYVFGSMNLFTDSASEMVYGNNLTLFTGITSQYSNTPSESVVPVKSYVTSQLTVNQTVIVLGMVIMMFVLPLGLLTIGIIIWMKRRKR
ncbi:MAG: Gldg family protein [Lachnospiraceae bacterium]